ncbi:otu domain-containing protein 3 [Plakobranchus ocellatus]|uniref:Otu domain-containing protein 3 n=1 Tax=Plakobranchus ocellatus TaxID=259542 RepID=A0AAV4AK22_9GAST|nr:otu domain-containing protein 3 [Plakobranchus ocellatus]
MPPGRQHSGANNFYRHHQQQQHKGSANTTSTNIHTSNSSINSSASSNNSTPTNTMTRNIGPTLNAPSPTPNGNMAAIRGKDRSTKGGGGAPPGAPGVGGRRRGGGPWPDSYLAEDENFPSFRAQLAGMGLQLRDIPADG